MAFFSYTLFIVVPTFLDSIMMDSILLNRSVHSHCTLSTLSRVITANEAALAVFLNMG